MGEGKGVFHWIVSLACLLFCRRLVRELLVLDFNAN